MEETKSGKKKSVNTKRKISVEEEEEEEETVQDENKNCLYDLLNVPKTASTAEIVIPDIQKNYPLEKIIQGSSFKTSS